MMVARSPLYKRVPFVSSSWEDRDPSSGEARFRLIFSEQGECESQRDRTTDYISEISSHHQEESEQVFFQWSRGESAISKPWAPRLSCLSSSSRYRVRSGWPARSGSFELGTSRVVGKQGERGKTKGSAGHTRLRTLKMGVDGR
jgi:hypothetical protein